MSEMPPLLLRPTEASDYPRIGSWIPDAAACARWAGPDLPFPFDPADLPELLALPTVVGLTMSHGPQGQAIGFGQYRVRQPGAVHLCRIVLSPEQRGQGSGRKLIEMLLAEAIAATGASVVTLRVRRDNLVAQAIYQSLGFVEAPELSDDEVFEMRLPVPAAAG
jgi:ribosomal-protein-alanine N-acetyltransferase